MSASTSAEPVRNRRRTGRFLIASISSSQPPKVPNSRPTLTKPSPLIKTRRFKSSERDSDSFSMMFVDGEFMQAEVESQEKCSVVPLHFESTTSNLARL